MEIRGEILLSVPVRDLPEPNRSALVERLENSAYTGMDYSKVDWKEDWDDIRRDISSWLESLYCPYYGEENRSDGIDVLIDSNSISFDSIDLYWGEDYWPDIHDGSDAAQEMMTVFGNLISQCYVEFIGDEECFRHVLKNSRITVEHGRVEKICKY